MRGLALLLEFVSVALVLARLCAAQTTASGSETIEEDLARVRHVGSALMIAAHPDDENTQVLAWLSRGRHLRAGYLSLTRGEGGQNLIGSEQGDALGMLRTEELLNARRIDGAEQFFSRAVDFGFSKSPKEAIDKWGHDAILSDIVWVIRSFRPDVIILRFSGTPLDGHGHHQASAILGKEAYEISGDPTRFPEQLQWVKPWKAKRLVWNAFAFTPEQKKKAEATANRITVDAGAFDPVLGRSYAELASLSRSQHRSQGMGVPLQRGPAPDYFVPVAGDAAKQDLFDGVDTTWNRIPGGRAVGALLDDAAATYSPNHPQAIVPMLAKAAEQAQALAHAGEPWATEKLTEIEKLLELCSGIWADATADAYSANPGAAFKVTVSVLKRLPGDVKWNKVTLAGLGHDQAQTVGTALGDDQPAEKKVDAPIPSDAGYSQPFWLIEPRDGDRYVIRDQKLIGRPDPLPVLTAEIDLTVGGTEVKVVRPVHHRYVDPVRGELTRPIEVVPPLSIDLPQRAVLFPNGEPRRVTLQVRSEAGAESGTVKLSVPKDWTANPDTSQFHLDERGNQLELAFDVTPPKGATGARDRFKAIAMDNGREIATGMQWIEYEHIEPQVIFQPSQGALEPLDLHVLAHNIGYVMGAGDAVPDAIRQMGCSVELLSEADLLRTDLSRFDAIVTGVRAYNVRTDLKAAEPRLLEYIRNGGTLVVQYNVLKYSRFTGESTQPGLLHPFPLEISTDRVVDEDSPITLLDARSPLLTTPNQITMQDFKGWIQERGLYFAKKWDKHYVTALATHDAGEEALPGGLLYARYGKGAYVFTAYSWFRELPAGVPGAYRIFANLLSAGKTLNATGVTAEK
jgi:LmbE family N-acetylglucosaminyl deacetylase